MRWIAGGRAVTREAASTSQMGRFETATLTSEANLTALADNLANFLRTLALPDEMARWSLTTLREKVVKIGAKVISHARYTVFQMAEVAVPREMFGRLLARIDALRPRAAARC